MAAATTSTTSKLHKKKEVVKYGQQNPDEENREEGHPVNKCLRAVDFPEKVCGYQKSRRWPAHNDPAAVVEFANRI